MSLELVRETLKVNQIIGEDRTRTVLDNDIIVPDTKPDVGRILLLDGDVFVNGAEAVQDKILINGVIRYKILYASDDPEQPVKSILSNSNFQYSLNIPDARHGMAARAKCEIEHIDYEILNSRKVNIKTILDISGKVYNQQEQNIARDFDGAEEIQVQKSSREVSSYLGFAEEKFSLKETMEIPAGKPSIREILRSDVRIAGKETKLSEGKVVAKGELTISTLYIGEDETGSIQYMEHEIPFVQFLDLNRVDENSWCEVDYRIAGSEFTAEEDSDGELRMLNCDISLDIYTGGYEKRQIEIIDDAYKPGSKLVLDNEQISMEELAVENRGQFVLKDTVFVEDGNPEISEVFNIICKPSFSDCIIENDRAQLEGVVNCSILYIAADEQHPIMSCTQDFPFRYSIELKGLRNDMACDMEMDIENYSYSMASSREVEVRLSIGVTARAIRQSLLNTVSRVTEAPLDDKRADRQPSLIIYFTQPGDTLWKVSKKYQVMMEDVRRLNNLPETEGIEPGLQILIPRKLA